MSHRNKNAMDWTPANRTDVLAALERIPAGSFLLTSAHTDQRGGVAVKWVQQCSLTPPMVMVAVEKGHSLSPVIRDSRSFAICQLDPVDRGTVRSFDHQQPGIDPFVGMTAMNSPSGAPVPARALSYIDCELARHVDIDGDYEIYVGVVHHASTLLDALEPGSCLCDGTTAGRARAEPHSARSVARSSGVQRNGDARHAGVHNGFNGNGTNGTNGTNGAATSNGSLRRSGSRATAVRVAPVRSAPSRKRR